MYKFKYGQQVVVHSLGDGKEYEAIVVGCVNEDDVNRKGHGIYILQPIGESWRSEDYPFKFSVMTDACIRAIDEEALLDKGIDVWGGDIIVTRQ